MRPLRGCVVGKFTRMVGLLQDGAVPKHRPYSAGPQMRGLTGMLDEETRASDILSGLRQRRIHVFNVPFELVVRHRDLEFDMQVLACAALGIGDLSTNSMVVQLRPADVTNTRFENTWSIFPVLIW